MCQEKLRGNCFFSGIWDLWLRLMVDSGGGFEPALAEMGQCSKCNCSMGGRLVASGLLLRLILIRHDDLAFAGGDGGHHLPGHKKRLGVVWQECLLEIFVHMEAQD